MTNGCHPEKNQVKIESPSVLDSDHSVSGAAESTHSPADKQPENNESPHVQYPVLNRFNGEE